MVKVQFIQPSQDFQPGIPSWFISPFLYICQVITVHSTMLPPQKCKPFWKIRSSKPMNRAAGVIEFDTWGWWQGHGEKPQVQLLPTALAVLQGFGQGWRCWCLWVPSLLRASPANVPLTVLIMLVCGPALPTPCHPSQWAAMQQREETCVNPAFWGKEASISMLQQILGYIKTLFRHQDWQKRERVWKTPGTSTAGQDALANTLPQAGSCRGALLAPLLSEQGTLGRSQAGDETPIAAAGSCGLESLQLPQDHILTLA